MWCSLHAREVKTWAWPSAGPLGPTTDGRPRILFGRIASSGDGRRVLVTWSLTSGPEGVDQRFAMLEREDGGWKVVASGRYGPIA